MIGYGKGRRGGLKRDPKTRGDSGFKEQEALVAKECRQRAVQTPGTGRALLGDITSASLGSWQNVCFFDGRGCGRL